MVFSSRESPAVIDKNTGIVPNGLIRVKNDVRHKRVKVSEVFIKSTEAE